jgi:hypothetical protein
MNKRLRPHPLYPAVIASLAAPLSLRAQNDDVSNEDRLFLFGYHKSPRIWNRIKTLFAEYQNRHEQGDSRARPGLVRPRGLIEKLRSGHKAI